MRNRWARVGVVVAVLVVVNFGARLVLRLVSGTSEDVELATGVTSLAAMGLVLAVAGFLTARRYVWAVTGGDLFFDVVITSLLVTLVGPFISNATPFGPGAATFTLQLLYCVGALVVGAAIGVLLAVAFGVDPKSRAWGEYASQASRSGKKR